MFRVLDILKVVAFCYAIYIITSPNMILDWYMRLIDHFPDWLYKPLGGCLTCFTGQVSLWYYLVVYWHDYNFVNHIFFISVSIVSVTLIDKIIDYET